MAADSGQNSAKRRSKNSHGSKTKRQKVTKGYKQSHSIGSRTSKVVTYSETIPIYQSVLAIYLENKKKGSKAVTSTSPSSKGSLPSPSIAKSSAPSTSKISHPSSSKGLVINPKIHTNKETISLATYNYNFPIPEIHLKRTLDYPMVGGKAKLPKPCVSTKIKKDNSDGMKIKKKDGQKMTTGTGAKKIDKNSPKAKDKTSSPKPKKDAADKKSKTEKVKAPKIKKDNAFVTPSKGDDSPKPGSKDCKSKLLKKGDKLKLLQNTVGEKRKQSEKVKKSKPSENKDIKPKLPANKGVKPKFFENMGDKCKESNLANINKGKKRKLNQNDEKTKTKTETKTKVRKIENTKTDKKIKKKDTKKSSKISPTQKIKQKQKKMADKKKLKADIMTNSLLDIFSLVRMKREASLNASARVNIMFEKLPTSPKTKCEPTTNHGKSESTKDIKSNSIATEKKNSTTSDNKKDKSEKTKKSGVKDDEKKKSQKDTKSKSVKDKNTNKEVKKVKDNPNTKKKEKAVVPIEGCVRRIASLNAQAIMAATKEFEAEPSERAARIDRYCVSWQCEPLTTKVSSAAHWVDGLGKTCCVTQTSTCFTTASKSDSITEESKLPAITLPESDIIEERPASVVDVTTHVASNPFLQPPAQCIGSFFSQSHSCIPPCSVCCNSMSSSQFKSFQLGPLNSLNSLQMMTYGHPGHPYRSAFSVPYNHTGMAVPHYGYYGNNYYQPTTGPVLQPDPCIVSHHVPIQVPQAQVKVLVHNPDSSHDHCAFTNSTVKGSKDDDLAQEPVPKRRCSSETKNKTSEKQKLDQLKLKRKYERKRSKSPSKEEPEKKIIKTVKVPEKSVIPAHGWSQCGQPEWKKIPNVVEGPVRERKCFPAMKHIDGDVINIRDCVLLRSGPRKKDIPFVAKVSALWENPEDGELMMSLLWYYRPEHTEAGRKPGQLDNELFACKHRDENSLACIDDKGYVLTYNEYCRYKAEQRRLESNLPPRQNVVPKLEESSTKRQRMPPPDVNPDNVFICRQVYDFRQHRILKNPS